MDSLIQQDLKPLLEENSMSNVKDKTILITGASGLMGTYFLTLFQELKTQNRGPSAIFVSTSTGIFQVPLLPTTEVIEGNLCKWEIIEQIPKVDLVIHCAGYAQPSKFLSDPFTTIGLNTFVTAELIKKLKPGGRFLFLSSSEVYSGLRKIPFRENQIGTTNTDHPRAAYIESKKMGEVLVNAANTKLNVNAFSIRLSLAYGPGTKKNDTRVLNSIIDQGLNKKIVLKDSGDAWRTYCYVSDAVHMAIDVLFNGTESCYNVGGKSRIQIKGLAKLIANKCASSLEIPSTSEVFSIGAPEEVSLDLAKVLGVSSLKKFVDLDDGINRTISWQKILK